MKLFLNLEAEHGKLLKMVVDRFLKLGLGFLLNCGILEFDVIDIRGGLFGIVVNLEGFVLFCIDLFKVLVRHGHFGLVEVRLAGRVLFI